MTEVQEATYPTSIELEGSQHCVRHVFTSVKYLERPTQRSTVKRAILDILLSSHPARVRLAALRSDLPAWVHYLIMWVPFLGCVHARAGIAENRLIRASHGIRLSSSQTNCLLSPLARNFHAQHPRVRHSLLFNEYALDIMARHRGLSEIEYRQIALMGARSGADALLGSNPDTPVSLLSEAVRSPISYWSRVAVINNPALPFEEIIWARENWGNSESTVNHLPLVDDVLNMVRWDEFQDWLTAEGHEELKNVPAEWVFSVLD